MPEHLSNPKPVKNEGYIHFWTTGLIYQAEYEGVYT